MTIASLLSPLDPINWAKSLSNDALRVVVSWVQDGAKAAIGDVAHVIGVTTTPQLTSTWFSGAYWRVAGVATLLTIPFLFAAALQAVIRSDLALLGRAVFGYLPLALIGVGIASPIATLLLSATDEMSNIVSGLAVGGATHFLTDVAGTFAASGGSLFVVFAVALIAAAAAIALALELLVRSAAVYIVVLMLPMAFAALVWPARRIWAIRLVELLVALIVSKFVIVAVLSLAGAAVGPAGTGSVTRMLTAMSLLLLSTLAPWTMLRLLPFTEIAASAAGALRHELPQLPRPKPPAGGGGGGDSGQAGQAGQSTQNQTQTETSGNATPNTTDPVDLIGARLRTQAANGAGLGRAGAGSSPGGARDDGTNGTSRATDSGAGGAGAGGAGAPSDAHDPETESARAERLPGMDPIWQADNGAWPPLSLGPDGWGGPTEYVAPDDARTPSDGPSADGPSADEAPPAAPSTTAGAPTNAVAPTAAPGAPSAPAGSAVDTPGSRERTPSAPAGSAIDTPGSPERTPEPARSPEGTSEPARSPVGTPEPTRPAGNSRPPEPPPEPLPEPPAPPLEPSGLPGPLELDLTRMRAESRRRLGPDDASDPKGLKPPDRETTEL